MLDPRLITLRILSAYVRHVPEHKGQWRLAQFTAARSPLLRKLRTPVRIRLKDGSYLLVDGTSQTGRIAFTTGTYEPRTTALIRARVRPGDTVVDVGANIGYFSIVAARAVGMHGRVLAFEPAPAVRRALEENLRLNHADNVIVSGDALGAQSGETTFYAGPATDTGLGSLRSIAGAMPITVRQRRFDDGFDGEGHLSLVKIDVEGGELAVLQGMTTCLTRHRPDIVLEITDEFLRSMGASAVQVHEFLADLGYQMWAVSDQGPLTPIRTADDVARSISQFNAYCSVDSAHLV